MDPSASIPRAQPDARVLGSDSRRSARLLPRLVRHRDAPAYLGVDRNRFDSEIRPVLTEIPIGRRGRAFDRLELDAWADAYIEARGRPSRKSTKGAVPCELGH